MLAPLLLTSLLLLPSTANAHTETGAVGGLISGFLHPLTGLDHVVAMVAVGLWGVFLGAPAVWLLPVISPVIMALGGALGVLSVPFPGVETGIALSGVILGLMVALAATPPLRIAGAIVGLFAIFHGHAHGKKLPEAANALTYAAGFVIATGLLHLSGIALGLLARWPWGKVAVRSGGAVTAAGGCISVPVSIKMGRSKWRRSLLLLATLVFSLCLPAAARAHSTIQGLEGFSAGALHSLTTPAHLLVIAALGLFIGQRSPLDLKAPLLIFVPCLTFALIFLTTGLVNAVYINPF